MRRISAQYVFTSAGGPLKRGIVTVADDNSIISVEDTGGSLSESAGLEFYNGILTPGFINCHCHLELSHMHGAVSSGSGLAGFITSVRETRESVAEQIIDAALKADRVMTGEGVVACGDISNNAVTFKLKASSKIEYITFIEVFGIDSQKAAKRIDSAMEVAAAAAAAGLRYHITPHSVYSVSRQLFTLLEKYFSPASLTELHFLESDEERQLASRRRGRLMDSYKSLGVTPDNIDTPEDHISTALSVAQKTGALILVHNTCITDEEIRTLSDADNIWFCLCPSSNLYISGKMPSVEKFTRVTERVVIGTDSLASNNRLSILQEMRLLHDAYRETHLDEIVRWTTINGATALGLSSTLGSIEPGKKPGLLLIENTDLKNLRLSEKSRVRRLL